MEWEKASKIYILQWNQRYQYELIASKYIYTKCNVDHRTEKNNDVKTSEI